MWFAAGVLCEVVCVLRVLVYVVTCLCVVYDGACVVVWCVDCDVLFILCVVCVRVVLVECVWVLGS